MRQTRGLEADERKAMQALHAFVNRVDHSSSIDTCIDFSFERVASMWRMVRILAAGSIEVLQDDGDRLYMSRT
jgi:hypothetical protein